MSLQATTTGSMLQFWCEIAPHILQNNRINEAYSTWNARALLLVVANRLLKERERLGS